MAAALALGLIFSGAQIVSDFAREVARIDSLVQQVAGVSKGSASTAAFTLDSGLAGQVVSGLMAYRAIRAVELTAEFERLLAHSSRPKAQGAFTWAAALLFGPDRTYDIPLHDPGGNDIGKLVIHIDGAVIGLDFLERSAVIIASGLLQNLLLAAVLTFLFYILLTKPFLQTAEQVGALDPRRPGSDALAAPPGHESDELGLLVGAAEGLRVSFAAVLKDKESEIAERVAAEEEIRRLNDVLEDRVEQRTAELQRVNRSLRQEITERKIVEEALQATQETLLRKERLAALGQLTGTVAHELRNPLGAVSTSVYVLRRKCAGQEEAVTQALEFADRGIRRCDTIITELLDFARAKGLQPVPTNLEDWLLSLLKEQQPPAGVTLRWNLETRGTLVRFDPEVLRRAVINVIDNAVEAVSGRDNGSDEEHQVLVTTRVDAARAAIEIADAGPGIAKDALAKVLEPLYSTKSFGTGLGLPTVQRIMEEHGGGLEIDSAPGQGTRVTLWLQRDDEKTDAA